MKMKINTKTKEQTNKDIKCHMKFIDGFRLMSISLSNLTQNSSEKLHGKNVIHVSFFLNMKKFKTISYYIVV